MLGPFFSLPRSESCNTQAPVSTSLRPQLFATCARAIILVTITYLLATFRQNTAIREHRSEKEEKDASSFKTFNSFFRQLIAPELDSSHQFPSITLHGFPLLICRCAAALLILICTPSLKKKKKTDCFQLITIIFNILFQSSIFWRSNNFSLHSILFLVYTWWRFWFAYLPGDLVT